MEDFSVEGSARAIGFMDRRELTQRRSVMDVSVELETQTKGRTPVK